MSRHRGPVDASALTDRLLALNEACELARGRLPEAALTPVIQVLNRAGSRRSLSADHTVVGFFGATGSGKSSLFNAVAGQDLARVAPLRPTTAQPLAAVWGEAGSDALLDWLDVHGRHQLAAAPGPGAAGPDPAPGPDPSQPRSRGLKPGALAAGTIAVKTGAAAPPTGLILLDLPDFDSTSAEHRSIVERMVGLVDVLVWVLDPQKYADAAVHHEFLAPLAAHDAVTMVVLNQIDRLAANEVQSVLASLRDILVADGLGEVRLLPVSAATGEGVDGLRADIRAIVGRHEAASLRLSADVGRAAKTLSSASGPGSASPTTNAHRRRLAADLAGVVHVEPVAEAVGKAHRRSARAATGWPLTRWLGKLRPDPLRRLGLGRADINPAVNRSSLPSASPAQHARLDAALRRFGEDAADGAPQPWRASIRRAVRSGRDQLPAELDRAIAGVDLGAGRRSWWWPLWSVLQWISLAAALAGLFWLLLPAALGFLQLAVPATPTLEGLPVPTLLLAAGLLLGILLTISAGLFARAGARRRSNRARRRLRAAIAMMADEQVIAPTVAEIQRCINFQHALAAATGRN